MPVVPARTNYQTDYRWVDLEQISPHAAVAVIAAEDQFFPFHTGFDFNSIREAMRHNEAQAGKRRPRVRGASTITQQVAKNLFLWSGRSYVRKGLEAYFTLLIELTWPKERILEVYLNVAQFGDGIYGVEAAAQRFYRMPAATSRPLRKRHARGRAAEPDHLQGECAVELRVQAPRLDPGADAGPGWRPVSERAGESHGTAEGGRPLRKASKNRA